MATRGTRGYVHEAIEDDISIDRRGKMNSENVVRVSRAVPVAKGTAKQEYFTDRRPTRTEARAYLDRCRSAVEKTYALVEAAKDGKWYKEAGYATWEQCCEEHLGLTKRSADRLIEVGHMREELNSDKEHNAKMGQIVPKLTDNAVRELARIEPEKRAEVVNNLPDSPTAADIRSAAIHDMRAAIGQDRRWVTAYRSLTNEQRLELVGMTGIDGSLIR